MGSSEAWIYLNAAGKLILHVENDGPRVLRHGLESSDTEATLEELRQYPRLYEKANPLAPARAGCGSEKKPHAAQRSGRLCFGLKSGVGALWKIGHFRRVCR
jgi:hypothetical protein